MTKNVAAEKSGPLGEEHDGLATEGPAKTGAAQDAKDMQRMGHQQQLKRNFHSFSILGLTCILIQTWPTVFSTATFTLINGGRAGLVWTFLATWICQVSVVVSLAEMVSMAPTAGGQYHWVSEFAPPRCQKICSYLSGWLAALGWQTFVAGSAYGSAATILIMASLGHPTYEPTPWQITVLTIGVALMAVLFNVFAAKRMPYFEGIILCCYVLGFFAIAIPLWVLAPKAPTKEVFTSFSNLGGWSSIGAACVIGQTSAATCFIGVDSAAHMAEEVKHASKAVPRMMLLTIALNGVLGFVMVVTYISSIQDVKAQILNSAYAYPYLGVFASAVGSNGGAIGMNIPITIIGLSACVNSVMAASRQAWSFARDDGLPFSRFLTKIVTIDGTPLPLNSMIASLCITIIIALLNLGGSEIVQSLLGLLNGAVGTTYILSIGCVLWRRMFGARLPPASFSLGKFGVAVNGFAFLYQTLATITSFFPVFAETNATKMNWSIAVYGGVAILSLIYYAVIGRRRYRGPVVRISKDT